MTTTEPRASYRFLTKYVIVNEVGSILWTGEATINSPVDLPESETKKAVFLALTARAVRNSTPPEAPDGRVVILAAIPMR